MGDPMDFTIYYNPYHNCRNMTISAMVMRLGATLEYLFGQAGLFYKEEKNGVFITPYYRSLESEFARSHGIFFHEDKITDANQFITHLRRLVEKKHTVAVMLDIYELPYSIYYRDNHDYHDIEIVALEEERFVICDHHFQYYGVVDADVIQKASLSLVHHLGIDACTSYYFTRPRDYTYHRDDFIRVLSENCQAMKGKAIDYLVQEAAGAYIGLQALEPMKIRITEFLTRNDQRQAAFLYELYKMVKEISHSRHHFHLFLKAFDQEEIAFDFLEAAQHWAVITNLLMRAYITGGYNDVTDRVERRFDKLIEKEMQNLDNMARLLAALTSDSNKKKRYASKEQRVQHKKALLP